MVAELLAYGRQLQGPDITVDSPDITVDSDVPVVKGDPLAGALAGGSHPSEEGDLVQVPSGEACLGGLFQVRRGWGHPRREEPRTGCSSV